MNQVIEPTEVTITHETLTNDPSSTEILQCVICDCQRDRAVAAGWRRLMFDGRSFYACEHEFPSVYENEERFRMDVQFALFCILNVIQIEKQLPIVKEIETFRQEIRQKRGLT